MCVQYIRGIPWVHQGVSWCMWVVIMSTSEDVQYIRGNYEYIGRCSDSPPPPPVYSWYLPMYSWYPLMYQTAPMYWTSPYVLNTHYTGCNCLIVSPFWAKSGKYYFEGISGKLMQLWKERAVIVLGFIWSGEAVTASNLREYTTMGHIKILGKLIIIFMIMFLWHIGI